MSQGRNLLAKYEDMPQGRNLLANKKSSPAVDKIMSNIESQSSPGEDKPLQMQEEFSNPTQMPGFDKLPMKDKLQRISNSQFDPANQTASGGLVPPGTNEQPYARNSSEFISNLMMPYKNFGSPIWNSLGRITQGTALNTGLSELDPGNKNSLGRNSGQQLAANTLMEAIPFGGGKALKLASAVNPWARKIKKIGKVIMEDESGSEMAKLAQNKLEQRNQLMEQKEAHKLASQEHKNALIKNAEESHQLSNDIGHHIVDQLGHGANSVEESGKQIAKDIYERHAAHKAVVGSYVNPVLEKNGHLPILQDNKETASKILTPPNYEAKPEVAPKTFLKRNFPSVKLRQNSLSYGDVYRNFKKNPNLRNGHAMQQEIGNEIGSLQSGIRTPEVTLRISELKKFRDSIKNKMESTLEKQNPEALKDWKTGLGYWENHVLPYRSNKAIKNIAEGKETNPKNIHTEFEYPSNTNKYGEFKIGDINKILHDLPASTRNRIIYGKLGGHVSSRTGEKLLNDLDKAHSQGYGSHFSSELNRNRTVLRRQIEHEKHAKTEIKTNKLMHAPIALPAPPAPNRFQDRLNPLYRPGARLGANAIINQGSQ